ncbi:beta-ketoacyl-ACP synthase III [Lentilactobacillus kosonis]|uniref:Beta-ketoacyl-[acyl-carrier-protein] synthase III n=1 Tax=Lentilactobacillus kosonis TaxID=2810561 RepID=A0A401FLR9_9LACO|nr:beta-ketoacyl-ACP synthase III [Lentilactobacillus kosonis]GAY73208.1 3-oxoacyl-[acyl-carrier-protein] synthase, KASIII [Lentilactobacillus kosonis]
MKYENISVRQSARKVPSRVVTNNDLAKIMATSDEWITQRTGIKRRHIANTETTTSLCVDVSRELMATSDTNPEEIDYIVIATMSPDYLTPSVAATVQGEIGAKNAIAFDLNAACSGFSYGLSVVQKLLVSDESKKAILIGGEVLSKLIDWHDRSTAVLFGDGAAGMLLENSSKDTGAILGTDLNTLGELGKYLTAGQTGDTTPFQSESVEFNRFFTMNGRRVYNFAVKNVPLSIEAALKQAGVSLADVDHFVLHQANVRIIERISEKLGVNFDKFDTNISEYGNTAAASEPILFDELVKAGKINRGDIVVLSGFGGGLTIGTIVLRY